MSQTLHNHDTEYNSYLDSLSLPSESLFYTDVDLWAIYLDSFTDPGEKQYHNCHACRQFIQRFGNLVAIDRETGEATSALWKPEDAPSLYSPAVAAMKKSAESAKVVGVFLSSDKTLGTPVTGEWTHFAVSNPKPYRKSSLTSKQAMAEKTEDYRNVSRALGEFSIESLQQVVELLESDAMYRSEKVLGPAKWLLELKTSASNEKHQLRRKNIVWKAIADAPAGFCHPRSSMVGTLLDDISNGLDFADAARRFKDKMHPLKYQRPSAAPSSGAILAAEKMVKELGVERSLERRYATLDDMQTIWARIATDSSKCGGVFDHLKNNQRDGQSKAVASGKITWKKFESDVLPKAKSIDVLVPRHGHFVVFVSAQHEDSPVIFQWGNHVSWYHWHGGAPASQYGLAQGWTECKAICLPPFMWGEGNMSHFEKNVAFILSGARETRSDGNAIFPETLKSEFHAIRSVIEAHSRSMKIKDTDGSHVVGLGIGSKVRVHTSVTTEYEIDRWD